MVQPAVHRILRTDRAELRRPAGKEYALPGLSIAGIVLQVASNIPIFPAVKLLSPSQLFRPELGASPSLVAWAAAFAAACGLTAWLPWWGRISWARRPAASGGGGIVSLKCDCIASWS